MKKCGLQQPDPGNQRYPPPPEQDMKIKRSNRKSTRKIAGCTIMIDMMP
jgi:hypothetical protein